MPSVRRILVCPQEFKGSLTASEAARTIAEGARNALASTGVTAEVVEAPMADGGPGTASIVAAAAGGALVSGRFTGPLGVPVEASLALIEGSGGLTAVVESAATAGLVLLPPDRREPMRASTSGVGEQIVAALDRGARRVIVGVGGTGTNDGGAGAAQALGLRLLDERGELLPPGPLHLDRLARIDARALDARLAGAEVRVAVDVTNRLLGPEGATAVYGPQKGVTPELAPRLEAALGQWAMVCTRDLGVDIAALEGGGAGGGLAAGLVAATGGRIESGAALVADAIGLRAQIEAADLVITGEGRLDAQTAYGKVVAHVAVLCRDLGRPCLAVAGSIEGVPPELVDAEPSAMRGAPLEESLRRASELTVAAAERLIRRYLEPA